MGTFSTIQERKSWRNFAGNYNSGSKPIEEDLKSP